MNGDDELPRRSSSPLKRRASGMNSEADACDAANRSSAADGDVNSSGHHPRAMSVDAPEMNGGNPTSPSPPLQEQIKIIETLLKASNDSHLDQGDTAYLVSRSWLNQALALRTDSKSSGTSLTEASLGPVDNSDIIEEAIQDSTGKTFVRLKPGLGLESFELFSGDAWKLVMDWYGLREGQHPIVRFAVNTAENQQDPPNIMYEFHPPVFHIHRLWSEVSPLPIEQSLKERNPPPLIVTTSFAVHAQAFLKDLKTLAGIPMDRKVRLWSLPVPAASGTAGPQATLTPPDSPGSQPLRPWPNLLLDLVSFSQVESKTKIDMADQTANDKYNGSATLKLFLNPGDENLVIDEAVGGSWVSIYTQPKVVEKLIPSRVNVAALSSKPASSRSSPFDGILTRSRAQKKRLGRNTGAMGLHNLGNTCYMNSALQCVRSVEELSKYFLTESYLSEINDTNVLGYEGRVAMAYGNLLREIYDEGKSAVSPRDFKTTVGRCRPTFSGWGQQDSQEFLGFLLDALQEDLSRIKKKPYIEKPDSTDDMINKPEAIREMAAQVWDITRRRDDSVIADLFTGMYKSTLKCPECGKISITFDPFNNLTLPLPLENMWTRPVKFFPLNDVPVKIDVELSKHSSMESLKQFISSRTGVPANRLMGAEEFKDRFFKIYDNSQDVSEEIQQSDTPTMHEVEAPPTNWPGKGPRKKYRSMLDVDVPLDSGEFSEEQSQVMVVPVLHRRPHYVGRMPEGISPPHFITLTRKEACSFDAIQRKVLEKVATFSTWSKLSDDTGTSDSTEGDLLITTASDADSSGDSKVAARSVEGEDDMVDISMRDAQAKVVGQPNPLKCFSRRRPRFADPNAFLDPELQNLFELCYFRNDSDGPVPTGWSSFDNSTVLDKLSDRIPDVKDMADHESPGSTMSGNEDSSNEDETGPDTSLTRMTEESSDEDASPAPRLIGRHGRQAQKCGTGGRKKFKGHKTYGKKGNKRRDKQMRVPKSSQRAQAAVSPQPAPRAVPDGGPLIRLYEGIVVDWNEDAWDIVFGNPSRRQEAAWGSRTFVDLETLHDPALKVNQRRRQTRQNEGITLEQCLDEFERAEILSEQDMWYCPRCKEHRRASKKFDLWKTPDILVAHLKRFSNSGWRREKLDVLVDFPIDGLDLTSRVIEKEDGKVEIYDLIAIDDHYGGLGGGHYTAYAKNFVDGRWYSFNDSSVHVVSDLSSMVTSAAYLLFYRRRSSGPLGGPRFAEILAKYDRDVGTSDDGNESGSDGRGFGAGGQAIKTEDDEPSPYPGTIRRSIEGDADEAPEPKSLDMTQTWTFDALDSREVQGSTGGECGSDDVQFDSGEDRARGDFFEQDTDMASSAAVDDNGWEGQGVLAVPAQAGSDGDSDEVAEIHIEGDRTGRQ